ncbi:MAG: NifB/NifX family molybdenum-iron cluster-binding protein [Desulfurivibrionaceae bacterium]|nr:NifB/NifX family molybdenum-iron cluster-binding protein [Desulfurivibrionaceae bacterium]
MKLCVTSAGKDFEARIDPAFGRAPYFIIMETATSATEVVANRGATQGRGAGIAAAQILADKGVEGVLTGQVGPNTFQAFAAAGIKMYVGASAQDTVKEALAKFKAGEYPEASATAEVPHCGLGPGRGAGGAGRGRGRGQCRPV